MLLTKMMKLYQEKTGKDPIAYADFENGISSYIEGPSKDYLNWVENLAEKYIETKGPHDHKTN